MQDDSCSPDELPAISNGAAPSLLKVTDTLSVVAPDYINAMPWIQRERM